MQIGRVEGANRVLGRSQGYLGLPVRDEVLEGGIPAMRTAWLPTSEEIAAIVAGAPIHVILLGLSHPPIRIEVGAAPEE